jgi:hypothetical protein
LFTSGTAAGTGDAGRPDAENAGPKRRTGALAIAVTGITVLRTAGDLHSDHRGRSNALMEPTVNDVYEKRRAILGSNGRSTL